MKIAVTYEDGNVFQHFGHTQEFKVYTVENEEIVDSKTITTDGEGHSALAMFLDERDIDVLICGGIGGCAVTALEEAGIEICSGACGNADEAVKKYIGGELVNAGVNCNHHDENPDCKHDGNECMKNCGGNCHGAPEFEGPNVGKTCRVHYKGTFNNGEVFDSSYDRGEPLEFECGAGMMIKGFDKAVATMQPGEIKKVHLLPEEAYGERDENAIFTIEIDKMPGAEDLQVNQKVYLANAFGQPFPVVVAAKDDITITFDANSEMAGKELNFEIELVEVI